MNEVETYEGFAIGDRVRASFATAGVITAFKKKPWGMVAVVAEAGMSRDVPLGNLKHDN